MPVTPYPWIASIGAFGIDSGVYGLMNTAWGWPIAEAVHFIGICLLFAAVGMFDLRMIGLARGVSMAALHRLIPIGVAGFLLCAVTGLMFVLSAPFEYIQNPAWQIKMALMALAGVNMIVFYHTVAGAISMLPADAAAPPAARIFAAVSLGSWIGVIVCGRVITAFRPFVQ